MDFEDLLILSAILDVIVLICFFVLCKNVSIINKKLSKEDKSISVVLAALIATRQKEKARDVMTEHLIDLINEKANFATSFNDIHKIVKPYETIMKEIGMEFDVEAYLQAKSDYYK